ncbi:MAG: adenylate kinase [Ignavibacteriae bacterium HGW-Ignavibacteriae-3]|nr:MAG: adenylate kinase [Ignavibacteriae bacterium HGW-Ignavibacteriae-3]
MHIIIFGAPGVGKGTQAKILAAKLNIAHISTGDILREAIQKGSETGLKAKAIVESGGLVPDDIMGGIIKETLKEDRCRNGYILDGFPRTIAQAKILTEIFDELGVHEIYLIKLDAADEVIVSRLTNRLVCSKCGNIIVNTNYSSSYVCPVCHQIDSYLKRKDDDEEVIRRRLLVYHETTSPVFNYYTDKAIIFEINGTESIEVITDNIINKLQGS